MSFVGTVRRLSDYGSQETGQRLLVYAMVFIAFLLLVLIGPTPFREMVMTSGENQGDVIRQASISVMFVALLVAHFTGSALPRRSVPITLILTLAWCTLSILWAVDPGVAVRRLILTIMVVWMVFRSVADLGADRTLQIVRYTLVFLLVTNFVVVFATDYGVHPPTFGEDESVIGDWRGILAHKNLAGATSAFTLLIFFFQRKRMSSWVSWSAIGASAFFLVMTQSKTSQSMALVALAIGYAAGKYHPRYRSLLGAAALLGLVFVMQLAVVYSGALEDTLNDPGTLTGRAQIWPLLLEYIAAHPLGGAGFGSFWQIGPASPIWGLTGGWVAQYASHGHNGFLDLAATLGLPGLALAVVSLLIWPAMRLMMSFAIPSDTRALLMALLAFCTGHNLTESSILDRAAIVEVFLLITVAIIYELSCQSPGEHNKMQRRMLRAVKLAQDVRPVPTGK